MVAERFAYRRHMTESVSVTLLDRPYVDHDAAHELVHPMTGTRWQYRQICGGFEETPARFSYCFPEPTGYKDRFFHPTYPTISDEAPAVESLAFALSCGAYLVTTNNAGGAGTSPNGIGGYLVNVAAAAFSRTVAGQVYGSATRPRGYLYGASGGALQTIAAMENSEDVWDGAVPMVPAPPNAMPSFQAIIARATRVLGDCLPSIADAMAPGGSGNPFQSLDPYRAAVLREATSLGVPRRGWWRGAEMVSLSFPAMLGAIRAVDPGYLDDFWSRDGYAGAEPAVQASRVRATASVAGKESGGRLALAEVSAEQVGQLVGADVAVISGPATGRSGIVLSTQGDTIVLADGDLSDDLPLGTQLHLDNSWSLALQYYSLYQVPDLSQPGWNQYRRADGTPSGPQRPFLAGPILTRGGSGAVPTGRFSGRMIMIASALDVEAFPWSADWYRSQAGDLLGDDLETRFRLWIVDNADHSPPRSPAEEAHIVSYEGVLQQALLDLDRWVADGIPPPASTGYAVDADCQIQLRADAVSRGGVQPLVSLATGGSLAGEITQGEALEIVAEAEMPPDAGDLTCIEWDIEGDGFGTPESLAGPRAILRRSHTFRRSGTFFPTVRVSSHRSGDATLSYGRVQNLAKMRVYVR